MPKQEKIDLILDIDPKYPNDPSKFLYSLSGPNVNGEIVTFTNDQNNDGIDVEFQITDNTKRGYVFPSTLANALAAKKINDKSHCPRPADKWPEFTATSRKAKNSLIVSNANSYLQYFAFGLYVTLDELNGPFYPCDPIGNNQNGSFAFR
jgi:hypothetical protein